VVEHKRLSQSHPVDPVCGEPFLLLRLRGFAIGVDLSRCGSLGPVNWGLEDHGNSHRKSVLHLVYNGGTWPLYILLYGRMAPDYLGPFVFVSPRSTQHTTQGPGDLAGPEDRLVQAFNAGWASEKKRVCQNSASVPSIRTLRSAALYSP
jgi:hypothetical protein